MIFNMFFSHNMEELFPYCGNIIISKKKLILSKMFGMMCLFVSLVVLQEMGHQKRTRKEVLPQLNQDNSIEAQLHKWYKWPSNTNLKRLTRYRTRFDSLQARKIVAPSILYWYWIEETRLDSQIEPYLTRFYKGKGFSFTCDGWRCLFQLQEPIYKELCVELFSIILFTFQGDMNVKKDVIFRLGRRITNVS